MPEDQDYSPGGWSGYDYGSSATSSYMRSSYSAPSTPTKVKGPDYPPTIETFCARPLIIAVDVTGSMGTWAGVIFGKLPFLDTEAKAYIGADSEISFMAVGDYTDRHPLQVQPFGTGPVLRDYLNEIVLEGGGGGNLQEAYELPAAYLNQCAKMMPHARPILIYIGDENLGSGKVQPPVGNKQRQAPAEFLRQLIDTGGENVPPHSVYLIYKTYTGQGFDDKSTRKSWEKVLGDNHIADLDDPNRVVDVILGILAQETAQVPMFRAEIASRQTPAQVQTVLTALQTVHRPTSYDGKSTMVYRTSDGTPTKSLI
jgi:hypothetical protein